MRATKSIGLREEKELDVNRKEELELIGETAAQG